ncbi:MAG: CbbQ/NirQ/NorQ C-terminal domain-containing protein [Nitrososphaerota archaeon]|nr:CbbQ/NirQ/NorQ C-terminal domain-containing protein [Nitrososphaerota archaeon]
MSHSEEGAQGTSSHKSEGDNARVTVKISMKPRFGKDDLKARYKVEKYTLSDGYAMGPTLQALVPKGTPSYVEHGENYVERIMRALYHFKQCALIGPSGTGKSIGEDEEVLVTMNGRHVLSSIGSLFEGLQLSNATLQTPDGWESILLEDTDLLVPSFSHSDAQISWQRAAAVARHRHAGKVLKVSTSSGRELIATPQHSFVTSGGTIPLGKVKPGLKVPIARHLPSAPVPKVDEVDLSEYLSAPAAAGTRVYANGGAIANQISAPLKIKLTGEGSWFFGFFVAEGYVGDGFASITNTDKAMVDRCIAYASSLGLSVSTRVQRGVHEVLVYSKAFVEFLEGATLSEKEGRGKGSGARFKKVPSFVLGASASNKIAFLRGYFEGDGWTEDTSGVLFGTSSRELANGLAHLLSSLGAFPSLHIKQTAKAPSYHLVVSWADARRLGLAEGLGAERPGLGTHIEKVQVTRELLQLAKRAYARLPKERRNRSFHKHTVDYLYRSNEQIGMSTLRRIAKDLESGELMEVAESNVLWDKIVSVTEVDYDGWVYDFEVPGTETFVAGLGGMVTHNTHITYLVAELAGLPLWEINCGLQTSVYDLFGRFVGLGKENWVDGQIVSWCRYGGILYLDEANMMKQDIATRLNPILDTRGHMVLNERDNEVIPRHPNGYVIISMNPYSAEFAGTKPLNAAFRRRMTVWIDFDYLSVGSKIAPDEVEMIAKRAKIDSPVAEKLVRVAAEIRRQYKSGDLPYAPSVGDLVNWGTLVADGLTPAVAAEETIIALTADDPEVQNNVRRVVRMVVGDAKPEAR